MIKMLHQRRCASFPTPSSSSSSSTSMTRWMFASLFVSIIICSCQSSPISSDFVPNMTPEDEDYWLSDNLKKTPTIQNNNRYSSNDEVIKNILSSISNPMTSRYKTDRGYYGRKRGGPVSAAQLAELLQNLKSRGNNEEDGVKLDSLRFGRR